MIDINELLNRVVAVAKEGMDDIGVTKVDGYPYFYHIQGSFPYFVTSIPNNPVTEFTEDFDLDTVTVSLILITGYISSGVPGEREKELYTYLPKLKHWFNTHEDLATCDVNSTYYRNPMDWLFWCRCTRYGIINPYSRQGVASDGEIAGDLTLTCRFNDPLVI